jgi:ketosteroid isomerase-like protein
MGTAENLQVVKNGFAAFGRGDIPGLLSLMADDVVWDIPGDGLPLAGSYRGREGVARFFQKLGVEWEILDFQPREFLADGDRVLVVGWERVRVKETGRGADVDWSWLSPFETAKSRPIVSTRIPKRSAMPMRRQPPPAYKDSFCRFGGIRGISDYA